MDPKLESNQQIPLSVVVITKNEEARLAECLDSVLWAKEIIVIDDESTDRTVELAKKYTDRVFVRKMEIEGSQRNFSISQASSEWVLSIDADERVSLELANELKQFILENDPTYAGGSIPIKTFIGKRWIKTAGYYPARKLRLFRKNKFRYEEAAVHPRVFFEGKSKIFKNDIIHYGIRDFWHFIHKLNIQTSHEAEKWIKDGRKVSLFNTLRKTIDRFLRNYIGKKGYKEGFLGFMMSAFHSLYQLFSYAKYWEMRNKSKVKKVIFIDRDGVINFDPIGDYIKKWEDFRFMPHVFESLKKLANADFEIVIISNQAGIGDGIYSKDSLDEITKNMLAEFNKKEIAINKIYYCLHGKEAKCGCRKPKTGLFEQAAREISFVPSETYFIGDKHSDVLAGQNFGLRTIFVLTGHGSNDRQKLDKNMPPDAIVPTIKEAADYILEKTHA